MIDFFKLDTCLKMKFFGIAVIVMYCLFLYFLNASEGVSFVNLLQVILTVYIVYYFKCKKIRKLKK